LTEVNAAAPRRPPWLVLQVAEIDAALAEPDRDHRAAMWAEIDQQIMADALIARSSG
jgi:hypothetical protein